MKKFILKEPGKILLSLVIVFFLFFQGEGFGLNPVNRGESQEQEAKKAKLYRDIYPLISELDLYCSFYVLEEVELETRIIGAEREKEKVLMREHDIFYINRGRMDGLETGQIFLILEIGPKIKNPVTGEKFGRLALKRGRAQVVAVEESQASAMLEKACGQVMVGQFLVPFEEKGGLLGKDLGYDVSVEETEGFQGMLIYLVRGYQRVGRGHWAIIDLGEEDGIKFGQQLIIYREWKEEGGIKVVGNLIVIDTQKRTSTVKILSSNEALRIGDKVQTHF